MHEKVQEFLNAKKLEEKKKKEAKLVELGLYEKVYAPNNNYSEEYTYTEWDNVNSTNRYYKKIPLEVTNEEYEQIIKYSNNDSQISENSPIASTIKFIAIVLYVFGFIAGLIVAEESVGMMFVIWIMSFVTGTAYLGFAEIIKLLQDIKNK